MTISQPKAISRLYEKVIEDGLDVPEGERIETITTLCEKSGKFIFHGDSYWSFVKSKKDGTNCIRMVFALKEDVGGKVKNIDKLIELIRNIESTLIFVDAIEITKKDTGFIYLDVIKLQLQ